MLLSNGLHHSENLPVKFGFSPKIVPANIAKKLPPQRCSQPFLIPIFNFSHKRHTFAFTGESGYTLAFAQRIAHSCSHDETQGISDGALSLPSDCFTRFGNPAWPGAEWRTLPLSGIGRGALPENAESLGTAMCLCASLSRRRRGPAGLRRPTPPAERTVLAPISPRVQLCLRRPAFPLSAFIPGA